MRPEDLIQFNPQQQSPVPQMQIPLNRPNPAMVPPEQQPQPQASPQLKREQRLGRYRDLIANFTYSLGSGMSAANANPRGQAQRTQAGIGAILTAPMELQNAQQAMRIQQQGADDSRSRVAIQQQQQEALSATEQRKQRAAAIMSEGGSTEEIFQRLIRAGLAIEALEFRKLAQDMENDQSLNKQRQSELEARTFNAAQGSVAPEMDLPGEVYPPRTPGAPMSQAPTVRADVPLPSVQVGGQMLRPQSAQDLQRAAIDNERQTQKLQQEFGTPVQLSFEERTAEQWLRANPGKTLNDYQNMDANRNQASVGGGGLTTNQEALEIERLSRRWLSATSTQREMNRQISIMNAGMEAAKRGDMAAGSQAVLVTFQKILDPTSVVRESEYARSAAGQALLSRIEGAYEQLVKGGAGIPLAELQKFSDLAKEMAEGASGSLPSIRKQIAATADRYGIPRDLVLDDDPAPSGGSDLQKLSTDDLLRELLK